MKYRRVKLYVGKSGLLRSNIKAELNTLLLSYNPKTGSVCYKTWVLREKKYLLLDVHAYQTVLFMLTIEEYCVTSRHRSNTVSISSPGTRVQWRFEICTRLHLGRSLLTVEDTSVNSNLSGKHVRGNLSSEVKSVKKKLLIQTTLHTLSDFKYSEHNVCLPTNSNYRSWVQPGDKLVTSREHENTVACSLQAVQPIVAKYTGYNAGYTQGTNWLQPALYPGRKGRKCRYQLQNCVLHRLLCKFQFIPHMYMGFYMASTILKHRPKDKTGTNSDFKLTSEGCKASCPLVCILCPQCNLCVYRAPIGCSPCTLRGLSPCPRFATNVVPSTALVLSHCKHSVSRHVSVSGGLKSLAYKLFDAIRFLES